MPAVVNPFVSKAQRAYLYAKRPAVARKFARHTPKGKKLPKRVRKKKKRMTANARVVSPSQLDPTRTATLRRRWAGLVKGRLRGLLAMVRRALVDEDALGLLPPRADRPSGRWRHLGVADKVAAFKAWLWAQAEALVLSGLKDEAKRHAVLAFRHGAGRSFDDAKRLGYKGKNGELAGIERESFLRLVAPSAPLPRVKTLRGLTANQTYTGIFAPASQEIIDIIAAQTFDQLEGITVAMSNQISAALVAGLQAGDSPYVIAQAIADATGISLSRAEGIARTEIISAYAEGQLQSLAASGVTQLGVQVEFTTAGDSLVCFPKWTTVATPSGFTPIQDVCVGDLVVTRWGPRKVVGTSRRQYRGSLTHIVSDGISVVATSGHHFFTELGWIEARDLAGCSLKTLDNKVVKIDSLTNFILSDAADSPSSCVEIRRLLSVLSVVLVPILAVNLDGNSPRWDKEINGVSSYLSFLHERYSESLHGEPDSFFNGRLACELPVAREGTKTSRRRFRTLSEGDLACLAPHDDRWTSALLRAVTAVVASASIDYVPAEGSTASFAFGRSAGVFHSAFPGTVRVPPLHTRANRKLLAATRTCLGRLAASTKVVACPGAELSVSRRSRSINRRSATAAGNHSAGSSMSGVAPVGAEPVGALLLDCLRTSTELLAALIAPIDKCHSLHLLTWVDIISHMISRTPLEVYNVQVADYPEYFANGVLVLRCGKFV